MTLKEALSYDCSTVKTISCGSGAWAATRPPIRSCKPLSSESSICLIDWRPSRWLSVSLIGISLLAAISIWLCALPATVKPPTMLLAAGIGLWLARREARQPAFSIRLSMDESRLELIHGGRSRALAAPTVLVRGPLATVTGRDEAGRLLRIQWWPDTLPAGARRALRLASGTRPAKSGPALATMPG